MKIVEVVETPTVFTYPKRFLYCEDYCYSDCVITVFPPKRYNPNYRLYYEGWHGTQYIEGIKRYRNVDGLPVRMLVEMFKSSVERRVK